MPCSAKTPLGDAEGGGEYFFGGGWGKCRWHTVPGCALFDHAWALCICTHTHSHIHIYTDTYSYPEAGSFLRPLNGDSSAYFSQHSPPLLLPLEKWSIFTDVCPKAIKTFKKVERYWFVSNKTTLPRHALLCFHACYKETCTHIHICAVMLWLTLSLACHGLVV